MWCGMVGHLYISHEREGHRSQAATGDQRVVGARVDVHELQQPWGAAAERRHNCRDHRAAGGQSHGPGISTFQQVNKYLFLFLYKHSRPDREFRINQTCVLSASVSMITSHLTQHGSTI